MKNPAFALSLLALTIAQTSLATTPDDQLEIIVVIGQAASLNSALDKQRNSDAIRSVIHADGIGQLPDHNAAEALQRVAGVSVERDQGEGRFVTVRGIAPDLNAVTINGTQVPAPESDRRAVALDVLPSELVQSLSVVKSLTPDLDANSLGGTVEVASLSAFDHKDAFATFSAEVDHDDNTAKQSGKISGAATNIFSVGSGEENLGVAIAASWQDRKFGSDNIETGGAWDIDGNEARLEELEQRRYIISRERTGVGINIDYLPSENSKTYLRTLYSEFADSEVREGLAVEFADPLLVGERADGEAIRSLKARTDTQTISSVVVGGETRVDEWLFSAQAGLSRATEKDPGGIAGADFESEFENLGYASTVSPSAIGGSELFDFANYELAEIEWEKVSSKDEDKNIRFDISRDYTAGYMTGTVKFGAKHSQREKSNKAEVWVYDDFTETNGSAFAQGRVEYAYGKFGQGMNVSAIKNQIKNLNADDYWDEEESLINDFSITEDITSAYVMNTLDTDDLRIIAGVRYEATDFTASGTGLRDDEFEASYDENDYDHWLPSLHARYSLGDNTYLRAAWTNSVVRPTFFQTAPGFAIDGDEAEFGNAQLKPLESSNLDFGIEHYTDSTGVISAFLFHKTIKNFIYQTDVSGTGLWADFDEAITYVNGDDATVYGIELNYSQNLNFLPAPWDGLVVGANATFSSTDATIEEQAVARDISFPNQSDQVGNLSIGWENDKFSIRVAANYKSEYLYEVGGIDEPATDVYVDPQTFVDVKARYSIQPNLQVTFEAANITDEDYYAYSGHRSRNAQLESYGPSFKVGITFTHF